MRHTFHGVSANFVVSLSLRRLNDPSVICGYARLSTNGQYKRIRIRADPPRNFPVLTTSDAESLNLSELTADIVAAFVANNALPIAELPALIQSAYAALAQLASGSVIS